jgi:hypothetical protein
MKKLCPAIFMGCAVFLASPHANASEEQFLNTLEGQYQGQGRVRLRVNKAPIAVDCTFKSATSSTSLTLEGRCRGLLVVSRSVGAKLQVNGGAYTGSYVGAGSGPASLSGKRRGNALHLAVRWAKEINGDRLANLSVAKIGERGLRLTTTDRDPSSGKTIVTSEITFQRK